MDNIQRGKLKDLQQWLAPQTTRSYQAYEGYMVVSDILEQHDDLMIPRDELKKRVQFMQEETDTLTPPDFSDDFRRGFAAAVKSIRFFAEKWKQR